MEHPADPIEAGSSIGAARDGLDAAFLPQRSITLEEALEEVGRSHHGGTGRFQRRMLMVCGAGWWADNGWLNAVILIELQVQTEFELTNSQATFLLTTLFIGEIAGGALWGPISDRIGRKPVFVASLAIAGVTGIAAACAPSYGWLLVLLFVVGSGVGGNLPVDGALFAELVPRSQRGRLLTIMSAFWSLGNFSTSLMAWALIPAHSCEHRKGCQVVDNMGWRLVIGLLAVLNLISLVCRIGMPESPAYLLKAGRVAEANMVMANMAAENGHGWCDVVLITSLDTPTKYDTGDNRQPCCTLGRSLRELASIPRMLLTVALLAVIWFFSNLGYGLFNAIVPRLLKRKGIDNTSHLYRDLLINSACGIPGSLMASWLVNTALGRTNTMAIAAALTAASLAAFNLVANEQSVIIANAGISLASQPMYAALYLYTPEVVPCSVRGTIVSWLAMLSRTSGTFAPTLADWFLDNDHELVLWILSLSSLCLTALSAFLLPIETRGRQSGA